jgi:hypothetical protein
MSFTILISLKWSSMDFLGQRKVLGYSFIQMALSLSLPSNPFDREGHLNFPLETDFITMNKALEEVQVGRELKCIVSTCSL